jgi:hypothetical protein
MTVQERKQNLLNFKPDIKNDNYELLIDRLARVSLPNLNQELLNTKGLWRITDDNMATEYKLAN